MPDDDYSDDELSSFSQPLPPEDRLWRHPSELRGLSEADEPAVVSRRPRWGTIVASSLVGASAALLAVVLTGMAPQSSEPEDQASGVALSTTVPVSASTARGVVESAAAAMGSVAHVAATGNDATVVGSALVIQSDGYLLTDAQTLRGAEAIDVTFPDGGREPAEVVGVDPVTELAVIRVTRHGLTPVVTGPDAALRAGELAMALGSTKSGGPSISSASISALNDRCTGEHGTPLYGMIRLDSPIPTGAGGGPLITERGHVVGVSAKTESGSLFGWATPIGPALAIAEELIEHGHVTYAWLGIEGRRSTEGPTILKVAENSPAAAAGLEVSDVIVSLDGQPLTSMVAVVSAIRDRQPGDTITIAYRRADEDRTVTVELGQRR